MAWSSGGRMWGSIGTTRRLVAMDAAQAVCNDSHNELAFLLTVTYSCSVGMIGLIYKLDYIGSLR